MIDPESAGPADQPPADQPPADQTPDVLWWARKAGPEHDAEHLPRLRDWVAELAAR